MTHSQRRDRLAGFLTAEGLDAMLVSDLINVRYLSGFTGSNAALLVSAGGTALLATDSRYRTQAARQCPDLDVIIERACGRQLLANALARGARRIGFEGHVLTVDAFAALRTELGGAELGGAELGGADLGGAELVRASGAVESLRVVKDAGELALLRLACEAADGALTELIEHGGVRAGRTERAVARDLEALMLDHGADGRAFETIVAAGANSAIPHHRPTDAILADGDLVKIDFGALVGGYHSDMTRTFVLGSASVWQREIFELVATAQRAGREALACGVALSAVDGAARAVIAEAGYGDYFGHGLGHGVGLQIHEAPSIGAAATGVLPAGAVVTVEPGVYLEGRGGVRIEDTVAVDTGAPEVLTRFPKELMVLP